MLIMRKTKLITILDLDGTFQIIMTKINNIA